MDTTTTLTLGHSAGGHLAVWAAGRQHQQQWSGAKVQINGALSQAGVLDLRAAHDDDLGGGAVEAFLGHAPTDADIAYDPQQQIPLAVPVRCIHGGSGRERAAEPVDGLRRRCHQGGRGRVSRRDRG